MPPLLTEQDVRDEQRKWADAMRQCPSTREEDAFLASELLVALYGLDIPSVFKPTKAVDPPFCSTREERCATLWGGAALWWERWGIRRGMDEGRVSQPDIVVHGDVAHAMGWYDFVAHGRGDHRPFSFGYKRCDDGALRICLHHSSFPYRP